MVDREGKKTAAHKSSLNQKEKTNYDFSKQSKF